MNIAIIASTCDEASMNIREALIDMGKFEELDEKYDGYSVYSYGDTKFYTTDTESVYCEEIELDEDFYIFITKHQSKSGIACFTCHVPGNWDEAFLGGKEKTLCWAYPSYLRTAFLLLKEAVIGTRYEAIQECTHHGPYVSKPCMFVEIGSTEAEWTDADAGIRVAGVVMKLIEEPPQKYKNAVGIGGLHHMPNLTKVMEKTDFAFGHACPKYMLESLSKEMMLQTIEKTVGENPVIVLDWKGLKTEKQRIVTMLEELGISYLRTDKIEG